MFELSSRYSCLGILQITSLDRDGSNRIVSYVQRRFIPPSDSVDAIVEHVLKQGERLDHLAVQYFGEPTLFWRICDAAAVLDPDELTGEIGRIIGIATLKVG